METQLLLRQKGHSPQFSTHVYCGQTAVCNRIPLGTEVGLSLGDILLDGDSAPPPLKGYHPWTKIRVGRRSRRTFSTDFDIIRRRVDDVVIFFQIFRRHVGIFSHFFMCCFYFIIKGHANFFLLFFLLHNKSSVVAEVGNRLAIINIGRREGEAALPHSGGTWPHQTQCGLGRDLPPYQVASLSIQPFRHHRYGSKIGGCCAPF